MTEGTVHDSPIFRKIYKRLLDGDGYAILDAAYDAFENCKLIADSGRIPAINPRANSVPKGYNARARMTRRHREDPEGFVKVYGLRNLAESVFSSIKSRLGVTVRGKSLAMQTVELFVIVCYNLTV